MLKIITMNVEDLIGNTAPCSCDTCVCGYYYKVDLPKLKLDKKSLKTIGYNKKFPWFINK